MVFKKMLASLGAGTAEVETVLQQANVQPGGTIEGEVSLQGGSVDQEIQEVRIELVARVEVESGDNEYQTDVPFHGKALTGKFTLDDEDRHRLPFSLDVPMETPITTVFGQYLRGMAVGVRTVVAIEAGVDQTDLDPITVQALPAQQAFLDAFSQLGFRFMRADLEQGRLRGVSQTLPFYQEIEFAPSPQYAGAMKEVEVTFVAGPQAMEVVLEVDKRGGLFTEGRDSYGRFTVDYAALGQTDWAGQVHGWLNDVGRRRGIF